MPQYPITIAGNLTAEPKIRTTPGGNFVCEIRIAASRSIRDDSQPSGWRDIDHLFINGEMWGQLAQNAAASLAKGMAVVATGRIVTQEWDEPSADTGETKPAKRQKIILKVDRLGLDLSKYVASTRRTDVAQHQVEGVDLPDLPDGDALVKKNASSFAPADMSEHHPAENSFEERQLAGAGAGGDTAPF